MILEYLSSKDTSKGGKAAGTRLYEISNTRPISIRATLIYSSRLPLLVRISGVILKKNWCWIED